VSFSTLGAGREDPEVPRPTGSLVFALCGVFHIAGSIMSGSLYLVHFTFGLQLFAANHVSDCFLGFANRVVDCTLNVFLVHMAPLRDLDAALYVRGEYEIC
jgi:hypothetical protein